MTPFFDEVTPREVAFVGNGTVAPGAASAIDSADWVVRFNKARGFGGATGVRADDLFLVNVGGQVLEWMKEDGFAECRHVAAARRITLPVANGTATMGHCALARGADIHGVNFEHDLRARLSAAGKSVRTMPDPVRRDAKSILARPGLWPSTGALALFWYESIAGPETRFTLYGFTFEGATMHDWPRERAWSEDLARRGRARIVTGREAA